MKITGKLTKHLSWAEVWRSYTAKRLGIKNWTNNARILKNIINTANMIFEPIRNHFGVPINVNSFYRSRKLNAAIGGSRTSDHVRGRAIDLDDTYSRRYGVTNKDIFEWARENLDFDQLIWEFGDDNSPDWVHISYRGKGKNRKQVIRSYRVKKGIRYEKI